MNAKAFFKPDWNKLIVTLILSAVSTTLAVAIAGGVGGQAAGQGLYVLYSALVPFDTIMFLTFGGSLSGGFGVIAILNIVQRLSTLAWQYALASLLVWAYVKYAGPAKVIVAPKKKK